MDERWNMRRYGDNVSPEDISEEEEYLNEIEFTRVLYGGCAAGYESFPRPRNNPEMSKTTRISLDGFLTEILIFLGLKRKGIEGKGQLMFSLGRT